MYIIKIKTSIYNKFIIVGKRTLEKNQLQIEFRSHWRRR